ncbi:MAG: hypothetical protein WKF77_29805, partial [Planctomycetaceae bacterium]
GAPSGPFGYWFLTPFLKPDKALAACVSLPVRCDSDTHRTDQPHRSDPSGESRSKRESVAVLFGGLGCVSTRTERITHA